jgi:hypothetical protein
MNSMLSMGEKQHERVCDYFKEHNMNTFTLLETPSYAQGNQKKLICIGEMCSVS